MKTYYYYMKILNSKKYETIHHMVYVRVIITRKIFIHVSNSIIESPQSPKRLIKKDTLITDTEER